MLEILEIKFLSSKNWCKMPKIYIWLQKNVLHADLEKI